MSIRQWRHARLTWADAANYYESKPGRPTDWSAFVVFDEQDRTVRGPGDALAHLRSRTHLLTALDRRIVEAPGRLDYPYWVRAQLPPEQRIEYREWAGGSFTDCIDAIADLCADPLDVRRRAWCLHVFAGVSDPDDPTATVTVVVLQVSHAGMVGSALGAFLGTLFGADGQPLRVPGLAPAATRPHHAAAAVSGVARFARWYLGSARSWCGGRHRRGPRTPRRSRRRRRGRCSPAPPGATGRSGSCVRTWAVSWAGPTP
ncbi:hypothetical protein [Rhodococcus ruber]|uniref:hypothetical protein n=1 Tax=Rhodococcus ruber TaxID=1830 RepID=UPI000347AF28|nr:hypothetical protein [Rhodococcus ruber]